MGWRVLTAIFCLVMAPADVRALTGNQYDLHDDLRSWTCTADDHGWSTGDVVLLSHLVDGAWTNEGATCAALPLLSRCPDAAAVPENARVTQEYKTSDGSYTFGVYYECASGFAWLSGERGRLTQCKDRAWTHILDICTEECPDSPVKDCLDVHNLGFRESKLYRLESDAGIYKVSARRPVCYKLALMGRYLCIRNRSKVIYSTQTLTTYAGKYKHTLGPYTRFKAESSTFDIKWKDRVVFPIRF
ncbi:uncharacterized protein LOC119587326 [Penaeus monodon]|uniref:uncharacterized protein LOC119587326 n=1 Tax=Penaeus monodon TaxID=6687 RepID=UPI0018A6EE5C|nr:uncharacterized protein LOC119587326 [Penaeus monodon]